MRVGALCASGDVTTQRLRRSPDDACKGAVGRPSPCWQGGENRVQRSPVETITISQGVSASVRLPDVLKIASIGKSPEVPAVGRTTTKMKPGATRRLERLAIEFDQSIGRDHRLGVLPCPWPARQHCAWGEQAHGDKILDLDVGGFTTLRVGDFSCVATGGTGHMPRRASRRASVRTSIRSSSQARVAVAAMSRLFSNSVSCSENARRLSSHGPLETLEFREVVRRVRLPRRCTCERSPLSRPSTSQLRLPLLWHHVLDRIPPTRHLRLIRRCSQFRFSAASSSIRRRPRLNRRYAGALWPTPF